MTNLKKEIVIDSISKLPDEFSIEEIIERPMKIEKGRQQIKEGNINTEERVKVKLGKWLS